MDLSCYCDHCLNSTCHVEVGKGTCFAQVIIDGSRPDRKFIERYYCLKKTFSIIQEVICSNTNISIRRCCDSSPYCNKDLLPSQSEVQLWASTVDLQNSNLPSRTASATQLPNETEPTSNHLSLGFIFIPGLFILSILALAHIYIMQRRKKIGANRESPTLDEMDIVSSDVSPRTNGLSNMLLNKLFGSQKEDNNTRFCQRPLMPDEVPKSTNSCLDTSYLCQTSQPSNDQSFGSTHSSVRQRLLVSGESSSSDVIYLNPRSIANDIELIGVVGKGRFGVVWHGEYKGRSVGVKIFSSNGETLWIREKDIYNITLIRHKNILGFIAADMRWSDQSYWLVTDYYPLGSLRDFICDNTISPYILLKMVYSITNGLDHLHTAILGAEGKPSIAHRDIKSTNILVKCDRTCCVADLGLAVRYDSSSPPEYISDRRVGTCRYLSPEILEDGANAKDFDILKASDVYAFALVMWELLRRTRHSPKPKFLNTHTKCLIEKTQLDKDEKFIEAPDCRVLSTSDSNNVISSQASSYPELCGTNKPLGQIQAPQSSIEDKTGGKVKSRRRMKNPSKAGRCKGKSNFKRKSKKRPKGRPAWLENLTKKESGGDEIFDTYQVPYQTYLPCEATLAQMRDLVVGRGVRPAVSYHWTLNEPSRTCVKILYECFYDKPFARPSALRIRRTFSKLAKILYGENFDLA